MIIGIGVSLRLASLHFNWFPHGNVSENARAALSIARESSLKVAEPSEEPYWYYTKQYGGKYLDLNAPLWSIINGLVLKALGDPLDEARGFLIFRISSFVFGVLVIIFGYLAGRKLAGNGAGLAAAGFISLSYFMAEFSGNGHFYMTQGALYLLWVLIAAGHHRFRVPMLGIISGIGWLLNYQAVAMIAATLALLLLEPGEWKIKAKHSALAILLFLLSISPLLVRNAVVFGNPLHTTKINMTYVWSKVGLEPIVENDVKRFEIGAREYAKALGGAITEWLPHNAYYAARKLFVLSPVIFIFFLYGTVDAIFSEERRRRMLPIFLLLGFHLLQASSWPIFQFRYFVPIFPLIAIVGFEYLFSLRPQVLRNAAVTLSFVALLFVNVAMYYSNPLHVCYYDCAVTTGPFGRNEELHHLKENGLIP